MIQWCMEYPLLAFILAIVVAVQIRRIVIGIFGGCQCCDEDDD